MIQIRNNIFETNSSSTHSMVIGPVSEFEKWERGELYYLRGHSWKNTKSGFIDAEDAIDILKSSSFQDEDTEKAIKFLEAGDISVVVGEDEDPDEVLKTINEELSNHEILEYEYYMNNYYPYLETETTDYTTPGGEKLRILCHYGYDG